MTEKEIKALTDYVDIKIEIEIEKAFGRNTVCIDNDLIDARINLTRIADESSFKSE